MTQRKEPLIGRLPSSSSLPNLSVPKAVEGRDCLGPRTGGDSMRFACQCPPEVYNRNSLQGRQGDGEHEKAKGDETRINGPKMGPQFEKTEPVAPVERFRSAAD